MPKMLKKKTKWEDTLTSVQAKTGSRIDDEDATEQDVQTASQTEH